MACVKSYASILLALHAMRMMRSLRLAGNTLSAVGVTRGLKSASTSGRVRDNKSSSLAHVPLRNSSQNRHRLTRCTVSACAVGRPEVDSDATEWRHCRRIRHCVTCCARDYARTMPGFTTSSVCVGLLLVVFSNSEFHRSHIASFFSLRCCMSSENDFALQGKVKYTNILKLSRKLFKRSTWIVDRENCAR